MCGRVAGEQEVDREIITSPTPGRRASARGPAARRVAVIWSHDTRRYRVLSSFGFRVYFGVASAWGAGDLGEPVEPVALLISA